ncbi:MAG: hypothetical protein QNJ97_04900 [Myxococcota bacterium]|nr:hypothetical protein [Myxococcota bacterium]
MPQLIQKTIISVIFATAGLGCADRSAEKAPAPSASTPQADKAALDDPSPGAVPGQAANMVFEGPGKMLPKKVGDFEIASAPRYFGPDNLYDLINGGAEIYAEYGLKKMVTIDYKSKTQAEKTVTVEVYDQGSLLGAFGRMARFLAGRTDLSTVGQGLPDPLKDKGFFGGTDLVYFKDQYLVHITLLDESPSATLASMKAGAKAILPAFASAVADLIPNDPALPADFGLFPAEHRIARGDAWEPNRVAGIDALGAGFTAQYKLEDQAWTLFITPPLEDSGAVERKAKASLSKAQNQGPRACERAGDRIIGFVSFDDKWTEKQRHIVDNQLKQLQKRAG